MNAVDIATVEQHGDDLVVTARSSASRWKPVAVVVFAVAVACHGVFMVLDGEPWILPVSLFLVVRLCWWFVSALRWNIDGGEEWRLAGNVLTYRRWSRDVLKDRREFDVAHIEHLGMRRRTLRMPHYEFAVVAATETAAADGEQVGLATYSTATARAVNDALRERLGAAFADRVFQ